MTYDHANPAYVGNNKANIFCTIRTYSLVQKLLSIVFLIVVYGTCLLFTIGFSCNTKNSNWVKVVEPARKVSLLSNDASRCVGSVTILDKDGLVSCIMVARDPLDQKSKWKNSLSKIKRLLYNQGSIAPQNVIRQDMIAPDSYRNVTCTWCDIAPNADLSDNVAATHPIDDAIPNWEGYGIMPFMPCQRARFGDMHTFSLDLDGAQFQSGEQLGFILVKNNGSPVDLVKHLLETSVPWPDEPYACIEDYLILPGVMLPGVIRQRLLQSECSFNAFTGFNSGSDANLYCYIKKEHHYCFVPLENIVPVARAEFYNRTPPKSVQTGRLSLKGGVDAPPVSPLSCKQSEPLDALPKGNDMSAKDRPISNNTSVPCRLKSRSNRSNSLLEELTAANADYDPFCGEMGNNSFLSTAYQDTEIAQMQEKALETIDKNVKTFQMIHKYVIELIKQTKIVTLNNAKKNKISLSWGNKIQSALSPALEAITNLQPALASAEAYQLGEADSRSANLSDQRRAVIQTLENLEEAVLEECCDVLSVEVLLNQVMEYLEEMYALLCNIRQLLLYRPDKTDDMRRSVKQLFIGNSMQLKEGQNTIAQLEQMEDEQLEMIRNFKQTVSVISEILGGIWKELVISIRDPLKEVKDKIDVSNLKHALKLKGNIAVVEGKVKNTKCMQGIITDLELKKEDIQKVQEILNSLHLESRKKVEKIEEALNNALDLGEKLKTEIPLKVKEMVNQVKGLKDLCYCYDSGYDD